jgi:phosphomethylpyrimidine synthase
MNIAQSRHHPSAVTTRLPSRPQDFRHPDTAPDLRVPLREIILSEGAGSEPVGV